MIHKLEADGIVLDFGSRRILSDVYIKCETGRVTGLLGSNGNGKSSLLNIIYGTLGANSKSIRFDGTYVWKSYLVPGLIGYLTQFNFIPKNLTLQRVFSDFEVSYSEFEKLFPEFQDKYTAKVKTLSGGQLRLMEIYILLKSSAKFIFLDEPFTFLSRLLIEKVKELITEAATHKGILVSDHQYREVIAISDDLYLLSDGKIKLIKNLDELGMMGYIKIQ